MSPFESFKPQAQTAHADASNALLGDTWAMPQPVSRQRFENVDSQSKDQPAKPEVSTPDEQVNDIVRELKNGEMTDNTRRFLAEAFMQDGLEGLLTSAQDLNRRLTEERSQYRLSAHARAGQDHIDIGVAVTNRQENTPAILDDIVRNGKNSQYYNRGLLIRIERRQEPPGQDV